MRGLTREKLKATNEELGIVAVRLRGKTLIDEFENEANRLGLTPTALATMYVTEALTSKK